MMMFVRCAGSDQFIARTVCFSFLALQSRGTGRKSSRVEKLSQMESYRYRGAGKKSDLLYWDFVRDCDLSGRRALCGRVTSSESTQFAGFWLSQQHTGFLADHECR